MSYEIMKAKNLQKATKILAEIHELDQQIVSIEKLADSILNDKGVYDFDIRFKKEKSKAILDEDGSLSTGESLSSIYTIMMNPFGQQAPKEDKEKLSFKTDETEMLLILSTLINVKKDKRKYLVGAIFDLGVSI